MSVTKTVARNTIFQVIGRLLYLVISILMLRLLTGYLRQEGFGQYSTLVDYLGLFAVVVDFGLYLIAVQKLSQSQDNAVRARAVGNLVGLRLITAAAALLVAVLILPFIRVFEPELKVAIAIAAVAFVSFSMGQLFAGVFQGLLRAEFSALSEVLGRGVTLVGVYFCYRNQWGLEVVSVALIVGNTSGFIFSYLVAQRLLPFRILFEWSEYRKLLKEAVPIGVLLMLSFLYIRQDTFLLKAHPNLPEGISNNLAVGIYKQPYKLLETIQGMPGLFLTALFPFMNQYIVDRDSRLRNMLQKAFDALIALAVPLAVGTLLLAPAIIRFTATGDGWGPSILTLQILIFAISFSFLNNFAGHLVIALGEQRRLVIPNIFFLILNLGLNLLWIPHYAYYGSALATVVTELVVVGVNFWLVNKLIGWHPKLGALLRIVIASAMMGGVVYLLDRLGVYFLINTAISAGVYLLLVERLGGLPDGMKLRELIAKMGGGYRREAIGKKK